jgi:uncharacterized protein (TIGR02266 family)
MHDPDEAKGMSDPTNQRRHERVDVRLRTVYHDEIDAEESDSLMSNLSLGGCFIRSSRVLPQGSTIHVKFKIPETEAVVQAVATVRWAQDSGPEESRGMGVQFTDISGEALLALKQFIAQKLESSLLW